jgi:ABC-type nitrate/sulfonate/bicarbonate transport system substrate-binding protein
VKDSSPIKSAKDFVGKKVVAQPTTITWYPLVVWLKHQGVDYNQVEFVSLPSPLATLQAFHEGKVDAIAAIDSAPPATMLLAEGGVHYVPGISDAEVLGVTQVSGWATTDDFIARHPGVVKRFVKALSLAVAWGNAHPAEAEAILNRLNDVPAAAAKYAAWRPGTPAVKVDPDSIRRWVSILEDFGQVKPGEVKPEDLYTNQFNP